MGTHGLFGFYHKGKYYMVYNHWDSYPDGLGNQLIDEILAAIKNGTFDEWPKKLENLKIINEDIGVPTEDDIKKLSKYTYLGVSNGNTCDWYCLLRNCQGSLIEVLESGYLLNCCPSGEMYESYAYVVNFDTGCFDFYINEKLDESIKLCDLKRW
jgi:hypothetical protein